MNKMDKDGYIDILNVHRDDMAARGIDVDKLSDEQIEQLAYQMTKSELLYEAFWLAIDLLAKPLAEKMLAETVDA